MPRSCPSLILLFSIIASCITPDVLDKLHIAHDPLELDGDAMTTLLPCELKAGPDPSFASLAQIPPGTQLPIIFWMETNTNEAGTWIRTDFNGKKGWIEDKLNKDESLVKYTHNDLPFKKSSLKQRLIVTQQPFILYQHSSEDSNILANIPSGTLILCRDMIIQHLTGDEIQIRTEYKGMDGWILVKGFNNPIQVLSENSGKEFITTLEKLNFREKPGVLYDAIDNIPAGTVLPVIMWSDAGYEGCWIMSSYKGRTGWICGEKYYNWVISTDDGKPLEKRKEKDLTFWDDARWGYPATNMTGSDEHRIWRSGPGISFPPIADEDTDKYDYDGYIFFVDGDWALLETFIWMGWVPIEIDGKPNMIIYSALSPLSEGLPQANPKEVADSNWDYVGFSLLKDGYPISNRLYIELSIYFMFKGDIDSMAIKPVSIYQPPEATEPLYIGEAKITHTSGIYETGHFYYAMEMPPSFDFDAPFKLNATIKCKGVGELEIAYPPAPEE